MVNPIDNIVMLYSLASIEMCLKDVTETSWF